MTHLFTLLANDSPFMHLGDKFRKGGSDFGLASIATVLLIAASIAAILWLLTVWFGCREGRRRFTNPSALFRELCRAHQLEFSQQRLLKAVAVRRCGSQPAEMFIEPQYLVDAADDAAFRSRRAELVALRKRLFGAE